MKRFFLYISYNGKNYCGWQNQPNGISIQQKIEESLRTLLKKPTPIIGAGRTDAGVHALLMTAHFDWDTEDNPDINLLSNKLNRLLPPDIVIQKIVPVVAEAHARFAALSRTYQYFICSEKDPFLHPFRFRINHPLDIKKMNEAANILFDYTDFTSFSKLHTDVKTNNCRIISAEWTKESDSYIFTIKADRFLRNMVRAIVGTLLEVGRGKMTPEDFRKIIESKDRCKAGTSVPAQALFLTDIEYPDSIFIRE